MRAIPFISEINVRRLNFRITSEVYLSGAVKMLDFLENNKSCIGCS